MKLIKHNKLENNKFYLCFEHLFNEDNSLVIGKKNSDNTLEIISILEFHKMGRRDEPVGHWYVYEEKDKTWRQTFFELSEDEFLKHVLTEII